MAAFSSAWKFQHGGNLQPFERYIQEIVKMGQNLPEFSMAPHLNIYFLSWSLSRGLGEVIFKTIVSWGAWGARVGGPPQEHVAGSRGPLPVGQPEAQRPTAQVHFLVLVSHACDTGPRAPWAEDACMAVKLRRTSQARSVSLASIFCNVRLIVRVFLFLFSDLSCSLILHRYVSHCWTSWTRACLEIWKNYFHFVLGSVSAVFSEFLFPPLWNTVSRYVLCPWSVSQICEPEGDVYEVSLKGIFPVLL